ncbi:MAG: IclR family transcriptional regulator domain-containing protein [Actinomycetes bacterium]
MHCTASGRSLLFDSSDEVVEVLTAVDLLAPTFGPSAPRDLDELLHRLRRERERGYALASEEVEIGLTSIGMPVRDHSGELVAVVNISGATSRMITRVDEIALRLRAGVASLEAALAKPYTRP